MSSTGYPFFENIDLKIAAVNYTMHRAYGPGLNLRVAGGIQSSMFFVEKGVLTLNVEGQDYNLSVGELFLKDVWQPIEVRNDTKEDVSYYVATFNFEEGYSFAGYSVDKKIIPLRPQPFEELFFNMHKCYEERGIGYKIKEKAIIYEIFSRIFESYFLSTSTDKNEAKIIDAVGYINQNLAKKISLDELSAVTNYSVPHLRRLFYNKFGLSPLNYITALRVKKAKEIISMEDLPFSQVAPLCGFENTSYFIKQFKNLVGVTPREYKSKFFSE